MNLFCKLIVCNVFVLVAMQNCRDYGETCNDDHACCGGCCMSGVCKDTYADCRVKSNPCLNHYCPPDQDCYIYQPEGCIGCGPSVQCRLSPIPPEEFVISTEVSTLTINSGQKTVFNTKVLAIVLAIIISSNF